MHVVDMIFYWAKVAPSRVAILTPEMATTYQGLADAIEAIGDRIEAMKLDKSETIGVSIAYPAIMLAACFAVLRSGHPLALANARLFPHLNSAGVRNLISDDQGLVISSGRNIRFDPSWLPKPTPLGSRKAYDNKPVGDVPVLMFTSGTTGIPKKFVQSAAGLEHKVSSPITCANGPHDKVLIVPNLAGGFGFNRSCEVLYMGKTVAFAPFGVSVLGLIENFRVDALLASTHQAITLAKMQREARFDLSSLTTVRIGGAVLNAEAAKQVRAYLCREIVVSYASTEAGTSASANYTEIAGVPGAVGFITPETEIEIVDEAGQVLPSGSEGLIRLRTPHFIKNVAHDDPEASGDPSGLWFYPGDIGRVTDNGILRLSGRSTDVINSGGAKVSAGKIEEVVQAVPGVVDVGACGVENDVGVDEIWVAVVSHAPVNEAEVIKRVHDHPDVGVPPARIVKLDEIPRTDLGKIQRFRLKELLLAMKKDG
jgi:acyl-coenzyme A synthetase/AMP-(fatty) acid ligase